MPPDLLTPLIRLGNLFPDRAVYAKCEFLAASGSFKIRGANHLLDYLLRTNGPRRLVVPSMGNTVLGAAVAAPAHGFRVVGVVPQTISRAKDEKLQALGVELIKVEGKGSELLERATQVAKERGAYFVHPHLDPLWTDGYQSIAAEIMGELPDCRSLVFPVGGGGLLMGLSQYVGTSGAPLRLFGCEPHNYPKYARFEHARTTTVADGLLLEWPHAQVQQRILEFEDQLDIGLVTEADICAALKDLFTTHALVVEPSSAIAVAAVRNLADALPEPVCVVLTGGNISHEDHARLMSGPA